MGGLKKHSFFKGKYDAKLQFLEKKETTSG